MASKCNASIPRTLSGFVTGLAAGAILVLLVASKALAQAPSSSSSLFLSPVTYASGYIQSLRVADVNGDGHPDLIAVSASGTPLTPCPSCGGTVFVLLGKGDGTFQTAKAYGSGGIDGDSVAVADINGDSKPDILVGNAEKSPDEEFIGSVGVLLGNGDGTFQPAQVYSYSAWGAALLGVADVNRDGQPDLAVNACGSDCGWSGEAGVAVWFGVGDGTFQPPTTTYATGGQSPYRGEISDLNGDGRPDLVVLNQSGTVGILLGNGDGTFQPALSYAVGRFLTGVAVADVNRDGKPDLIVTTLCDSGNPCGPGKVQVLLGDGDGTFQMGATYPSTTNSYRSVAVADVNGDGKADLLAAGFSVDVLLGNGDGTFRPAITISSGSDRTANSVTAADVNGDGKPDLLVGSDWYSCNYCGISVLLNNSGPRSPTAAALATSVNPSKYGQAVTFTAKVTTSGPLPPTGTVAFKWKYFTTSYTIGTATMNNSGIATLTRSNLNADPYPLTAVYRGDANNLPSTSPVVNQTVMQTTSSSTITSSLNPSTQGQSVTFTAKISSPTVLPTGPVTFSAGTTVLGSVQLSGGKATFTTSTLPAGSTVVKANYNGNSNIKGTSASVTQTVQP